jgi:hypothetical protein
VFSSHICLYYKHCVEYSSEKICYFQTENNVIYYSIYFAITKKGCILAFVAKYKCLQGQKGGKVALTVEPPELFASEICFSMYIWMFSSMLTSAYFSESLLIRISRI